MQNRQTLRHNAHDVLIFKILETWLRDGKVKVKILRLSDRNAESALAHWLQAMQSPSARSEADSR